MRNPSNERVSQRSHLAEAKPTKRANRMKTSLKSSGLSLLAAAMMLIPGLSIPAAAQPPAEVPAGRTILTFVNRLLINPPQVLVFGYFPTIEGLRHPRREFSLFHVVAQCPGCDTTPEWRCQRGRQHRGRGAFRW